MEKDDLYKLRHQNGTKIAKNLKLKWRIVGDMGTAKAKGFKRYPKYHGSNKAVHRCVMLICENYGVKRSKMQQKRENVAIFPSCANICVSFVQTTR